MVKKGLYTFLFLASVSVILDLFTFSVKTPEEVVVNEDFEIPKELFFCGERVPLESVDIKERFDREIIKASYWQSEIILYFKRAKRWFPTIERILKKNGIPEDFKYLAIAESGLSNVVSPVGASGYWQLMKKTGQEFGLEVNNNVDERYHIEKSTEAACKYLKQSYERFNSWTLVAASYNMGMNGLQRRLNDQMVADYYDLLLNTETSRYVFRILAYKEIFTNPIEHGFNPKKLSLYAPYKTKTVEIDSSISKLAQFALDMDINYKILKVANPWLRNKSLNNKQGKKYKIEIPTEDFKIFGKYCDSKSSELDDSLKQTELELIDDSLKFQSNPADSL